MEMTADGTDCGWEMDCQTKGVFQVVRARSGDEYSVAGNRESSTSVGEHHHHPSPLELTGALPAIPGVGIGGIMPGRLIADDP